jgi:hypothetical protein
MSDLNAKTLEEYASIELKIYPGTSARIERVAAMQSST